MNGKTVCNVILILLLSCIFAVAASANPQGKGDMHKGSRSSEFRLLKHVDLSAEQQTAVDTLQTQNEGKMKAARESVRNARKSFKSQSESDVSEQQIRNAFKPVAKAMEELAVLRFTMHKEIKTILTAEQIGQLKALRSAMKELRKDRGRGYGRSPRDSRL